LLGLGTGHARPRKRVSSEIYLLAGIPEVLVRFWKGRGRAAAGKSGGGRGACCAGAVVRGGAPPPFRPSVGAGPWREYQCA
jgi:hypothetical protein